VIRRARCACGQLALACAGEPVRVSVCHCRACQQRSGSAFAVQVRFPERAVEVTGRARAWTRTADSGATAIHHFCPDCGSTMFYRAGPDQSLVAVPLGAFDDPGFATPAFSTWEARRLAWVAVLGEGVEHSD
jgi:hypothetical protein